MKAWTRAAATAAALVALIGVVGSATFVVVRSDPPTTTTTTSTTAATTTTTTTTSVAAVAEAIAAALQSDLDVALTAPEALCIAKELLTVVASTDLDSTSSLTTPLASLDEIQRKQLVRGIVGCVPPATAAALLATPTTTSTPTVELPDEGAG